MLKQRPVQEVAPWLTLFTPELVLGKDGSLLATFALKGVDADTPNKHEITAARDQLDQACRSLDGRVTAWWRIKHRRATDYIDGTFASEEDAKLDAMNRAALSSGKYFRNTHSLALSYTPESGIDKIFEKVGYHVTVGGKKLPHAIYEALKDTLLARSAYAFDLEKTQADAKRFEGMLDALVGGTTKIGLKRQRMQESLATLHQSANPSCPPRRIRFPMTLLDSHLTESTVTPGAEQLLFESAHGQRFAAIVAVKEWLGFQEAALDVLIKLDVELDVCVLYRFLDNARANTYIQKIRRFYKMASFNLWSIVKEWASKEEQKNDEGREELAKEAGEALKRLTADGQQHGFANISVIVYGDTEDTCSDAVSEVVGAITNAGFGTIREQTNLMPAWNCTLPGRWDNQRRLQFVETPVVSDIAPICTIGDGPVRNDWLSDKAGETVPPLTCLPTRHLTAQRVDMHEPGGNGHVFVIGPIGNGKSVLLNFLMSQAGRHRPRRVRFDKDRSTRITTQLGGGHFIDVTGKFATATRSNPLSLIGDARHHAYVTEWLVFAIEGEDERYTVEAKQRQDLFEAVQILSTYPRAQWTLSSFATLVHADLRDRLQIWMQGGQYGQFFDNVDDAFEISDDLTIEMGDLLLNCPRAAALFIDYAFYRISQMMDGQRYTIIEIEEAGFFFKNKRFYDRLETWLTTIRKLNGAIWMATQSLRQIARIADFEVLKEAIANFIYLPNSLANTSHDLYCDQFGLTVDQVQMINDAVPNRDYLWVTKTSTRMLQTNFTQEMVARLRSDGKAQGIFDKHYMSREPGWQDRYVREVLAHA
ncbi:VirB4 family type IV secretion system protein [Ralstonia nicotianae]|uniref:VirB4 family type IV secretion system protein n=1 Tax=Ralstonia pseudosolanacearum TaxID=1310165 RepID=UPI002003075F|nr:conjugal transfer protein [Ralstonia pseudosolanacearum]MCK4118409.1 conjugal transfer protein [Ralstonia pseudosolanacearum]